MRFKTKLSRPQISSYFLSLPRVPETKVTIIIFRNRTGTKDAQSECSENQNRENSQNKGRSASQLRSLANCYLFPQGINVPSKHQTPGLVAIHLGHCQQCFKITIRGLWVSSHEFLSRNKSIIDKFFFFIWILPLKTSKKYFKKSQNLFSIPSLLSWWWRMVCVGEKGVGHRTFKSQGLTIQQKKGNCGTSELSHFFLFWENKI